LIRRAFEMDYRGVFCSATYPELEILIRKRVLEERNKPVFFPLLPLTDEEIENGIKLVKNYFKSED
jgi:hypothetical protein